MAIAPTGVLNSPVYALQTMLSNSANFQAIVGAANAAAALPYIFVDGVPGGTSRPWAYVTMDDHSSRSKSSGGQDRYIPSGTLKIVMEIPTSRNSTLTAVTDTTHVTDSSLIGLTDFFTGKQYKALSGAAAGQNPDITALISSINFTTGSMVLATALHALPAIGDGYEIFCSTPEQAVSTFRNQMGAVQADVLALSGIGPYISIHECSIHNYGRVMKADDGSDYCGISFEMRWGI
jgi:hypothetical protein